VTPESNFSECYRRSYCAVIRDQRLRSAGLGADQDLIISPEDAQLACRKRRIIVIGSLVLVFAILFGFFGIRPAGRAIKAWQARRHAQKAFAFINKEQWSDARSEVMAALQLSPGQPEALRAVARYLTRLHSIEALDFWKELSRKTSLTRLDMRDEAMIAIIAGDIALADTAMNELIDSHAEPADWLLAAQLAIQKNLPKEAKSYVDKIVADTRATQSEQFRATLLQLSLAANSPSARANALARLGKSAEGKTATSLDALVVLAQNTLSAPADSSDSTRNEARRLASALENHPLAKAKHKLLAFDLRMHADPTQREQLIARAIADWKDSEPADRLDLARWLNSKGEFQRAIDTIPLEKAVQSSDLFLQHLDALAGLGRWKEVEQLLRSGRFPLDPFLEAMYLARCNSQLGEQTASANNWQRALEAAAGDARKLITLAQYAEQNNNSEIAEAAYNGAAAAAPKLRMALASIVIGSDLNRMRSQGADNLGGGGGSSIPDVANIWSSAIPGAEPAGSGTVASTSGWSMLNVSQQTRGTSVLIQGTFSNDAIAANKTVTAGNGSGSGTNSGAAGNDAGSGISIGAAGAGGGQVSGNSAGSSGTTLMGERSTPTIPGGAQPLAPLTSATWTGNANSDWGNTSNWNPNTVPGSGDTASFNAPDGTNTTINLGLGGRTINTILFGTSDSGHYTIGSGGIRNQNLTLNDGAAIMVSSPVINDKRIDANVILGTLQGTSSTITFTNDSITASLTIAGDVVASNSGGGNGIKILALEGGNAIINGDIKDGGPGGATIALTKDGIGTWTLSGRNTYSGPTVVNGGTLLVNNTLGSGTGSGDVIVNSGIGLTTLGGTGTISGSVAVASQANLAPGNGGHTTAILTVGALTLAQGSNFRIDINGTAAGTGYDQLQVSRGGGPGGARILLSNLIVSVGTTLTVGDQFTIASHRGGFQGVFAQGSTVTADNGDVFSIDYAGGVGGNDIVLTLTAAPVPEPSTWIGGALAIAGIAFAQRRRLWKLIARRCVAGS